MAAELKLDFDFISWFHSKVVEQGQAEGSASSEINFTCT